MRMTRSLRLPLILWPAAGLQWDVGTRSAAFTVFYDGHYPSLCRALALALRDQELAEESAQEAFTRAYVYWRRVGRMDRPAGWVYVVAMRVAFRRRRREPDSAVLVDEGGAGGIDVADGVVDRESLRDAIARLPERQRVAIVLRYLADLPLVDVAAAMGCAVGTVKSTLHAARARLEVDLGDDREEVENNAD
jgi:RNA polymerase sigma factor (sigma-70 family)